ncbi:MAG: hypothetical protein JNK16_07085 [Phycisphaerales bacterium]|nr:hypothetical protein [Phycisphaerales bacterium]
MMKFSWILPALAVLAIVHALGMFWCIRGGMDAADSDRLAFQAVAQPLRASDGITASALESLEQNVAKRSVIHARVMYSYAAVHAVTAIGFAAAFIALRRKSRDSIPVFQRG